MQIKKIFILSLLAFGLMACGEDRPKKTGLSTPVQAYNEVKTLTGTVSDTKGLVRSGLIKVNDAKGKQVAKTTLDKQAHFKVNIPAGTTLPIELNVSSKATDEKLKAVVISKAVSQYDISSLTTKIAQRAKALGGYTYGNMVMAADSTVGVPEANKTSTGFRGDPTKQYGGWH